MAALPSDTVATEPGLRILKRMHRIFTCTEDCHAYSPYLSMLYSACTRFSSILKSKLLSKVVRYTRDSNVGIIQIQTMIGFSQDFQLYKQGDEEDLDTKNLDKNELYTLVTKTYMLPPVNSKGITREYLLQVKEGDVFRVTHRDHKEFEFRLEKEQQRKVGVVNNALLVRKLNLLLRIHGEKDLGFTEYNLPDQNWLYKVARYIDRTNLLEFFAQPVMREEPLSEHSNMLSRIHHGRIYASEYLFRVEKAKRNKKLWDAFEALSEKHRTLRSMQVNADILEHELRETRSKINQLDVEMHDMVGKVSFTYTSLEEPTITPELVIAGGTGLTENMRTMLTTNSQL